MTATAHASKVAQALQRPAVVPEGLQSPELLPRQRASTAGAHAEARSPRSHTSLTPKDLSLLYVGISPARETSRQTVRARVIGNHLNGSVGSSTFRLILAALLLDRLDLRPDMRGTEVVLSATHNQRLSAWQREHLLLTSCARERPWEIESEVMAQLTPPLNSAGNAAHAFYPAVRAARAEVRRRARATSSNHKRSRTV